MIQDVGTLPVGMIGKCITAHWGNGKSQATGRLTSIESETTQDYWYGDKIIRSSIATVLTVGGVTVPCEQWEPGED